MALTIDEMLSRIPDPRVGNRLEYSLSGLLKLVLLGKLCGRVTVKAAWRLAQRLPSEQLRRLGFSAGIAPCYVTITQTLKLLDANEVRLVFATAVRGFGIADEEAISIDGKALCGSGSDEAPAVKLLAAFSARLSGVIGEVPVPDGSNEIQAMMDLLDAVDLEGMILTGDAAFTQRKICDKIMEKKADYVFTVKDNQKVLKARVKAATEAAEASLSPQAKLVIDGVSRYEEEITVAHGRIESRRIIACPMPRTPGWKSVQQCFAVKRTRIDKKRSIVTSETAYGITSLPPSRADAKRLLGLNRGHWGIENKLHWVRDSIFKEDASTLRSKTAQAINATCNSFAIFLLKQAGFQSITHALETCADDKSIPINLLCGN